MIKKYLPTILISFFVLLSFGFFNKAYATATLYLTASKTTVTQGSTFTIYPRVNTGGSPTNSYGVTLSFPTNIQPISASTGGSICTLYTQQPSYSASSGSISCGLPSPGYNGSSGGLGSFTFKALSVGSATISITSGSKVLANDGQGTNILGTRGSIAITIIEPPPPPIETPTITSSHGTEDVWTNLDEITFTWNTPPGVTGFSYSLSTDQNVTPGKSSLGGETTKTYKDLKDGLHYFKVIATNGSQWSNPGSFTLRVDRTAPHSLEIVPEPNVDDIDKLPMISFNAVDDTSGIDHYEIKLDDGEYIITQNPYQFDEISSGEHTVTVKAVDLAGNFVEELITITVIEVPPPTITNPQKNSYLPLQEYLQVEGISLPNSIVYIYLNGELIAEVTTDDQGKFSYTHDKLLPPGQYEIYAVTKNEGGIVSGPSDIHKITVDSHAVKIGSFVIPTFMLLIVIFCLFFWLILLILFLYKRYRDYKNRISEDTGEAKNLIDDELDDLERTIRRDIQQVLSKGKQKVSKSLEHELERKVSEEIQDVEDSVERKLSSISKKKKSKKKRSRKKK